MAASVGPTGENLAYGDATVSARRHLSPHQFPAPVKVPTPSLDAGWTGPLGSYGQVDPHGSIYGYGVPSDNPQY